jgi:hypothetical protein
MGQNKEEISFLVRLNVERLFSGKVQGPSGQQPSAVDFVTSQSRSPTQQTGLSKKKQKTHPGVP